MTTRRSPPPKILAPHAEKTRERIRQQAVVLLIQDTTEFDFSRHAPNGVGCLDGERRLGFYDHTYLAITPDRLPLGVVGGEQFDRSPESLGKTRARKTLPIEQKESFRWLTGYRQASELAGRCPDTQIVSVADSEADIYDIFVEAQADAGGADFIIRAKEDRSTRERNPAGGPAVDCKVRDEVERSEVRVRRTIDLPQTPKRKARRAELEIRTLRVDVRPPHARPHLPAVAYHVVLVEEVNGPEDGTDVSWLLLATLPIESTEEVLRIVDYYVARWSLEVYQPECTSSALLYQLAA